MREDELAKDCEMGNLGLICKWPRDKVSGQD